jgi:DNA-binding NarL/FixJ family response regulator
MPIVSAAQFDRPGLPNHDPERSRINTIQLQLGLSPAQAAVALGVWYGLSEKQIASWLNRSVHTVHTHLRAIYERGHDDGCISQVRLAIAVERVLSTHSLIASPD